MVYSRRLTASPGIDVVARTRDIEKSASCHVGVSGRCATGTNEGEGLVDGLTKVASSAGKKAERPFGPDAVTSAMITGNSQHFKSSLNSSERPTAVTALRMLEGQTLEHFIRGDAGVGLVPERAKAMLKVQITPVV